MPKPITPLRYEVDGPVARIVVPHLYLGLFVSAESAAAAYDQEAAAVYGPFAQTNGMSS